MWFSNFFCHFVGAIPCGCPTSWETPQRLDATRLGNHKGLPSTKCTIINNFKKVKTDTPPPNYKQYYPASSFDFQSQLYQKTIEIHLQNKRSEMASQHPNVKQ
jgi:hypothetical protein